MIKINSWSPDAPLVLPYSFSLLKKIHASCKKYPDYTCCILVHVNIIHIIVIPLYTVQTSWWFISLFCTFIKLHFLVQELVLVIALILDSIFLCTLRSNSHDLLQLLNEMLGCKLKIYLIPCFR